MIPELLDDWTIDRLRCLLERGAFESDRLEWKEQLPRDDLGRTRLRITMAALANSDGGFIIFGVGDDATRAANERLVGVAAEIELAHELAQIARRCEPPIEHVAKNPPLALPGGRVAHVVHVPASARRPHGVVVDEGWRFPMRIPGGTRLMTWGELRDGFTDVRRRRRLLVFVRSEIERLRELGESVNRLAHNWRYAFQQQAVREFARVFDAAQVDHAAAELADDFARDPHLVSEFNVARELAKEWDAGAVEFASLVRRRQPTEEEIVARGQQAMAFGSRIHHAAHHVVRGIDRLTEAP